MKSTRPLIFTLAINTLVTPHPVWAKQDTVEKYVKTMFNNLTKKRLKIGKNESNNDEIKNKAFQKEFPWLYQTLQKTLNSASFTEGDIIQQLQVEVLKNQKKLATFFTEGSPVWALIDFYAGTSTVLTLFRAISKEQDKSNTSKEH